MTTEEHSAEVEIDEDRKKNRKIVICRLEHGHRGGIHRVLWGGTLDRKPMCSLVKLLAFVAISLSLFLVHGRHFILVPFGYGIINITNFLYLGVNLYL